MTEKKIVFLDNRPFLKELYEVNLKTYLSADVVAFEEVEKCVDYVKNNDFNVLICRNEIDEKVVPARMKPFLSKKEPGSFLFIVMGDSSNKSKDQYADYEIISDSAEVRDLLKRLAGFLGVTAQEMASVKVPTYYSLPTKLFIPGFVLKNPLYKKTSDGHKTILDKGKKIHPEIIEILVDSGHDCLYVEALDRLKVINQLSAFLLETLKSDFITKEGRIDITYRSVGIVHETIRNIGVDTKTMELAEESISSMNKLIGEIGDLDDLMKNLMSDEFTYTYKHCLLSLYIAHHLIDAMEWGSQEQKDKMTYVCFFHDISLAKDEYSRIHTDEEVAKIEDPNEQQIVKGHALLSAKIMSRYKELPLGVDTIIKQHHGSDNGLGLNKKPVNISPIACIFMIAEEWTKFVIQNEEIGGKLDKAKIVQYLKKKYSYAGFEETLKAIEKLTLS